MMAVAPVTDDWLNQDAQYNATLAALQARLATQGAGFTQQTSAYNQNYNDLLRQMGYVEGAGWDMRDRNTLSGKQNRAQQGNYAGRGVLQSSGYAEAKDDLMRGLNTQAAGLGTQRQQFLDSQANAQAGAQSDSLVQQQQARADALARRAGTYRIGG